MRPASASAPPRDPDPQPRRVRPPLGRQTAGAQHPGQGRGTREQAGADHRRPRLRRHLGRPGQQGAAEHGDRGVCAGDPDQDRPAVVPEPAAEAPQRPPGAQRDDGEQHGRGQQREHAERLARQHERDLVRGQPERDGRREGTVERQPVARGPTHGRGGRHEQRVARQHRAQRGGTEDPQPDDAVGLCGAGIGCREVGGGCEGAAHGVQRRSDGRHGVAGTPTGRASGRLDADADAALSACRPARPGWSGCARCPTRRPGPAPPGARPCPIPGSRRYPVPPRTGIRTRAPPYRERAR